MDASLTTQFLNAEKRKDLRGDPLLYPNQATTNGGARGDAVHGPL